MAPGIHPDWRVLITAPCLQSGIANLVGAAIGFVVVVVLILTVSWLLLTLLGGRDEAIIGAIAALCMFLAVLGLVTAEYIAWHDIKDPPVFEVTGTSAIANVHTSASETEPPKFISASTPLKNVTSVRVSAGRIARLLKYGDVVLCTAEKPDGAFVCQAVDNPHMFKEKVEWLVNNQPLISRLLPA